MKIAQSMKSRASIGRGYGLQEGFTLIELMVVVAIVAILASLAFASYNYVTMKTRRKEAESCITLGAQFMERFDATNMRYDQTIASVATTLPANLCAVDIANFYAAPVLAKTATTYTISIAPIGTQLARDSSCKTLATDQTGKKFYNTSTQDTTSTCW